MTSNFQVSEILGMERKTNSEESWNEDIAWKNI